MPKTYTHCDRCRALLPRPVTHPCNCTACDTEIERREVARACALQVRTDVAAFVDEIPADVLDQLRAEIMKR
jgi:hypothetical protein